MRSVHFLSCRAEMPVRLGPRHLSIYENTVATSAGNSKRFLDFARNDKNVSSRRELKLARLGAKKGMATRFRFGILALTWLVTSTPTVAEPTPGASEHTNRLGHEKSPYLLQHAHNPVDWYSWGEEAFAKARRENK